RGSRVRATTASGPSAPLRTRTSSRCTTTAGAAGTGSPIALQRGSLDDSFARNRRRNSMQEPESLSQPAADSDVARDVPLRRRLQHGIKSEPLERDTRFMKDARIRVRDAQYTAAQ